MAAPLPITRRRDALCHAAPDDGSGPAAVPAIELAHGRVPAAAPAIDLAPLVGNWVSFDAAAGGIARVALASRDGRLRVRAFGAFPAALHDWGEVAADAFADGVDTAVAVGFRAMVRFGFLDTLLAAYLNQRLLVVDSYNVFRDGSGRSSYFARDHFFHPAESAAGPGVDRR